MISSMLVSFVVLLLHMFEKELQNMERLTTKMHNIIKKLPERINDFLRP